MHVHLICLLVIIIISSDMCSDFLINNYNDIKDLTDWCTRNRIIYIYLTSGAEFNDKYVAMIASENSVNCTLIFTVRDKNYVMLVLEFPDMKPEESICLSDHNNSVTLRDSYKEGSCQRSLFNKHIYSKLARKKIAISFKNMHNMNTIKIIATSMRDAEESKSCHQTETECVVEEKLYCMSDKTSCDGHNNCGIPYSFDENTRKCKGPRLSFLTIFCTLLQGLVSIFLIVSIVMSVLPTPKETFVYKFDQEMSLFDGENGILTVEIDIKILFPEEDIVKLGTL